MKNENEKNTRIDKLLKQTLKDDLPNEAEKRMRRQLYRFWEKTDQLEKAPWLSGLLPKTALAVASILMVIVGGYMQATGSRNSLAENLTLLGTSVMVTSQVNNSASMECLAQLPLENGELREYIIQWLSPGLTRVDVKEMDQKITRTMWLQEGEITISNHESQTVEIVRHMQEIPDPFIKPILELFSPNLLSEHLYGEWQFKLIRPHGECEWRTYAIVLPEQKNQMEMTVDMCTYLPVEVENDIVDPTGRSSEGIIRIKVNFQWNTPISPQKMVPQSKEKRQNA